MTGSELGVRVRVHGTHRKATQSGAARLNRGIIECDTVSGGYREPLMGWRGSTNVHQQVVLEFSSVERAEAYARARGWQVETVGLAEDGANPEEQVKPRSYEENYRAGRKFPWTH